MDSKELQEQFDRRLEALENETKRLHLVEPGDVLVISGADTDQMNAADRDAVQRFFREAAGVRAIIFNGDPVRIDIVRAAAMDKVLRCPCGKSRGHLDDCNPMTKEVTDWPSTASDLISGDQERIDKHLPDYKEDK